MKAILTTLLWLPVIVYAQRPKADLNTVFVCLDSVTYHNLFQQPFIKDTLFFCKETATTTNAENYTGKYFFGMAGTLEFFVPVKTSEVGDKFGDLGVEFKTVQLNDLDLYAQKARKSKIDIFIDPISFEKGNKKIRWYDELKIKFDTVPNRFSISILEYQKEYLASLGFSPEAIDAPMPYERITEKLLKEKKYKRQFNNIRRINITMNRHELEYIEKVMKVLGLVKKGKSFIGNGVTIEYNLADTYAFRLNRIEINLQTELPKKKIIISEHLQLEVEVKKALLTFKY